MLYQQEKALWELNRIYREVEEVYHEIALKSGLSDSAFDIFYAICTLQAGCSQTDICAHVFLTKQTVNSSIRKLEQEGYIRMEHGKGRALQIYLTEAGQALAQERIEPVLRMEDQVFQAFDAQERREFLRLSQKYLSGLREGTMRLLEQTPENER